MSQEDRSQDQAILAFLKGLGAAEDGSGRDDSAPAASQSLSDDVDEFLRVMGYNRHERENLRRKPSRPVDDAKYPDVTIKRFKHYIAELLPDRSADEIAELAQAWVSLTHYNLNLAQRWWAAGVNPGSPDQLVNAINAGLQVEDLARVIGRLTVAEHLQAGNSLRWIMAALGWETSA